MSLHNVVMQRHVFLQIHVFIYNYYVSALLVVGAVVRLCNKAPLFPLNCVGCLFK